MIVFFEKNRLLENSMTFLIWYVHFQCNLNVIEKELLIPPKFVERFTTVTVKEGEPVSFSARAVGTPVPRITWQKVCVSVSD